jgi:hypothetical protein
VDDANSLAIDAAGSTPSPNQQTNTKNISIDFQIQQRGEWKCVTRLEVEIPNDTSEKTVKRIAVKYIRKNLQIYDSRDRMLRPESCLEFITADNSDVTEEGSYIIHLIPFPASNSKAGQKDTTSKKYRPRN